VRPLQSTVYNTEGGVRVPAFATWAGHIKPGSVVDAPLHVVDWYPTLIKLAGGSIEQPLPLDGRDAWPTITEGKPTPHEEILLNSTAGDGAIRVGDWKLVINGQTLSGLMDEDENSPHRKGGTIEETTELFNLAVDPFEKKNLADENPKTCPSSTSVMIAGRVRRFRPRAS
jgi:arylsulfatase A-like enzyme